MIWHQEREVARSLVRYGTEAVHSLAQRTHDLLDAERHRAAAATRVLIEVLSLDEPDFDSETVIASETVQSLRSVMRSRVTAALDANEWPRTVDVALLELLGEPVMQRTLAAFERLPSTTQDLQGFVYGGAHATKQLITRSLVQLAGSAEPVAEVAVRIAQQLTEAGYGGLIEVLRAVER